MLIYLSLLIFTIATVVVILFQLALAMGKPWGEYSMGGKFIGEYPPKMKVVAIFNALILLIFELIVLIKVGFLLQQFNSLVDSAIWLVVVFNLLGTIMNTITPSKKERNIWAPVSLVMLITSLIIALS